MAAPARVVDLDSRRIGGLPWRRSRGLLTVGDFLREARHAGTTTRGAAAMATCSHCGATFVPPFPTARLCRPCWQASPKPTSKRRDDEPDIQTLAQRQAMASFLQSAVDADLRAEVKALHRQMAAVRELLQQALAALERR